MARSFPAVRFERYCDDSVIHCRSEAEAHQVREAIGERLAECGGLRLHPDKTRIVYCQDGKRRGSYEHTSFTFLGYTFRSRRVRARDGRYFFSFNPAISNQAAKRIRAEIRSWRLHRRSGSTLQDLAREVNPIVRGWINYYGRFYKSALCPSLNSINHNLVRWTMQKYKRVRRRRKRARGRLVVVARHDPELFAHWRFVKP
ncbi:MAG: group II intron maturase-specific domain-containing protein [Acidimicrobiia bacterium]|nr:group II intron maturase-specific domain-containing protein [Acidimicrobiia bacterium]